VSNFDRTASASSDTSLDQRARSAAAERMRLYRQRRRDGVRCVLIELRDFEIGDLISLGLLRYETRNNIQAIEHALHKLVDQAMGYR
jgi:hypothetical protein